MKKLKYFEEHKRIGSIEMIPYRRGLKIDGVKINQKDIDNGSPRHGDYIARNPDDENDKWLVPKDYYNRFYTYSEKQNKYDYEVVVALRTPFEKGERVKMIGDFDSRMPLFTNGFKEAYMRLNQFKLYEETENEEEEE